jgi:hypothetical protein
LFLTTLIKGGKRFELDLRRRVVQVVSWIVHGVECVDAVSVRGEGTGNADKREAANLRTDELPPSLRPGK